jgi:hypothetical protein
MSNRGAWRRVYPPDVSSYVDDLMSVPRNFVFGLLAGALVPVAALAGIVAGVYAFTRKVPFVTDVEEYDGERRLTVRLVEPEEARYLWQKGKEAAQSFGDEIRSELEDEQQ